MDAPNRACEIVVIDDGSEDGTAEVARQAGAKVISHPYNIGNGVAVKPGVRNATGEILVMLYGSRFLLIIFKITTLYSPLKIFLPVSIMTFMVGFVYGLYKAFFLDTRYGPTSAILMGMAVLMFLVGLVSDYRELLEGTHFYRSMQVKGNIR